MRNVWLSLVLALTVSACASVPAKQKAVTSLASVQTSLEVTQDAERRVCNQASFDADALKPITECTGPLSVALGLTTAKHQAFAAGMAKAYGLQVRAAIALRAWSPGTPAPVELSSLQTAAQSLVDFLRALAQNEDQKKLVAVGQSLLDEIQRVIHAVKN